MFLRPYTHGRQNAGVAYVFISVSAKHTAMFPCDTTSDISVSVKHTAMLPRDTTSDISVCETHRYVPVTQPVISLWL